MVHIERKPDVHTPEPASSTKLDMYRWGGRHRVWLVLLLAAVFLAFAGASLHRLYKERDAYSYLLKSNSWIAWQLERELLNVAELLGRRLHSEDSVSAADIRLRFDILWSRVDVASKGVESEGLRRIEGALATIRDLQDAITSYDPIVRDLDLADRGSLQELRDRLLGFTGRVHAITLAFQTGEGRKEIVQAIESSRLETLLAGSATILVGILVIGALLNEVRNSQKAAAREHELRKAAEGANMAKTMFLANVSHELRTPLNAIIGFSEVMRDQIFGPVENDRYADYIRGISGSATHLHSMLSGLIDVSQIEAGSFTLDEEVFDPVSELENCRTILSGSIGDHAAKITVASSLVDVELRADPRLFRQIALNLISNAIKSRDSNAVVHASLEYENGQVVLTVADNGGGIPDNLVAYVTDPFFRVEGSSLRKRDGAGLGLSIVKSFAAVHGGSISIQSIPNKGTTVRAVFPPERSVRDRTGSISTASFNTRNADTSTATANVSAISPTPSERTFVPTESERS